MAIKHLLYRALRELKTDALYLYGTRIGAILLQSLSLFIIAATIEIEEFGRFTFMFSASQVATVVLGAGSPQFLQRILPARDITAGGIGNTNIVAKCFLRTFLLTSLGALVLFALDRFFTGVSPRNLQNDALLILLTGFLLSSLTIFVAVVRVARSATYSMVLRDLFPYLLFLVGVWLLASAGHTSAEVVLLAFCGALAACAVVALLSSMSYLRSRATRTPIADPESTRYFTFWGSSIAGASFSQLDILLARFFLDDKALGIYALIRRVSNLVSMPQIIANWTINVRVAKDFERGNTDALQEHASHGLLLALPVATMLFLAIALSSPLWLPLFHVDPTINVLALLFVLLLAQLLNVLSGANALFAAQCREEAYAFKARLFSLFCATILITLGALLFNSIGIAFGTLLSMVALNGLLLFHVKRTTNVWTSVAPAFFKRGQTGAHKGP